jgi:septum formation protein
MLTPPLILASQSVHRATLLRHAGLSFSVHVSAIDEEAETERRPGPRALVLAQRKAAAVAAEHADALVIGCDTVLEGPDGSLLEKPIDAADARRMLRLQSSQTSRVHTGIALQWGSRVVSELQTTLVTYDVLSAADIDWWMAAGEWRGCSGALKIDGVGQLLVRRLEGEWSGVVGLPLATLVRLGRQLGVDLLLRVSGGSGAGESVVA